MAGMIKKEDIERVRNAADLYDIVSATVALKPSGVGAYVGLCPFHDERTPS
ncbi:CHC2 zinc finger domain-containing protein, partial [Bifidobacterium animalis]